MNYTLKLVPIHSWLTLYVPDKELVKPTYEGLLAKNAATVFPFWAKIWPASKAMADFLEAELPYIKNKRVLEIGSGIGLPSFAIAKHVSEIIISDYATEAVELIEKNIKYLGLTNAKALCLDWNHFPTNIKAEVVLLSDINYAPDQFEVLYNVIKNFVEQGTTVIITTPQRITGKSFLDTLQPYLKYTIVQSVMELDQVIDVRILVLYV